MAARRTHGRIAGLDGLQKTEVVLPRLFGRRFLGRHGLVSGPDSETRECRETIRLPCLWCPALLARQRQCCSGGEQH